MYFVAEGFKVLLEEDSILSAFDAFCGSHLGYHVGSDQRLKARHQARLVFLRNLLGNSLDDTKDFTAVLFVSVLIISPF